MTKEVIGLVDELYEMRLETLLSVQDLVEAVVGALEVRSLSLVHNTIQSVLRAPVMLVFLLAISVVCEHEISSD